VRFINVRLTCVARRRVRKSAAASDRATNIIDALRRWHTAVRKAQGITTLEQS